MKCDKCGEKCYTREVVTIDGIIMGLCPICSLESIERKEGIKPKVVRFFMKPSKLGCYKNSDEPIYKLSIPRYMMLNVDPEHKYMITMSWDEKEVW